MAKLYVTHYYPDLDGITAIWLLQRFGGKRYEQGEYAFVQAGGTYKDQPADSDPDIIHVDTGHGMFDHHDADEYTCAAMKVYEHLKLEDEAARAMAEHSTVIDHFGDVNWPEPVDDRYDYHLSAIMFGWKVQYPEEHKKYVEWGLIALDGVYRSLKNKFDALERLKSGHVFRTEWGDAIAIQTFNDDVIRMAHKLGYVICIRRDPKKHYVRIKGRSDREDIDLTYLYKKLKALDPEATWFLHPDKKQLLNGNTKNPDNVYTELELEDIIRLLELE